MNAANMTAAKKQGTKLCIHCAPPTLGVPGLGIRGLCLEHRAQIAEELADALNDADTVLMMADRSKAWKSERERVRTRALAILAKVKP